VSRFNRICDVVFEAVRWLILAQAAAIFAIVVFTVIGRYGFSYVLSWSEEVPRYLLIWISFLGAALGVDRREHLAFDLFLAWTPARAQLALATLLDLGIVAFGWIMLRYGLDFVRDFGPDSMESIPFTNHWYYVAMPISGALIMLFAVRGLLQRLTVAATLRGSA
jgi:TRAP-type transport system small permease protein